MTLNKKSDVKMHFSSSWNKGLHLVQQGGKPAAIAFPVTDPAIDSIGSAFAEDYSHEHSSPGGTVSAVVIVADSSDIQNQDTHNTHRS
ncbi:MAG: hypothetical protein ABSB60_10135 [Terracidiphilus sp.]|jgi:hypothetical protein